MDQTIRHDGEFQLLEDTCVVDFNRFVKTAKENGNGADVSSLTLDELRGACGASVVCFPLEPKPLEVCEEYKWIAEYFDEGGVD